MNLRSPQGLPLFAGAAEVKVTPRVPVEIAGYHSARVARAVRDDLFCHACVLRSGGVAVAWVSCDVLILPGPLAAAIRRGVARSLGPRVACMAGATHTHSAPSPMDFLSSRTDRRFVRALVEGAVAAVEQAFRGAVPARVGVGSGRESTTVFQRRFLMRDGCVKTNPGVRNPEIVRPDGPVDPVVGLLKVESAAGRPIAAVVTFGNHVDTLGLPVISADWPGVMARKLKRHFGRGFVPVFLCGAQGNINHVNVRARGPVMGFRVTERIGHRMAAAVTKAWRRATTATMVPLAATERAVRFPRKRVAAANVAHARAVLKGVRLPYRVSRELTSFDLAKGCLEGERLEAQEVLALSRSTARTEASRLAGIAVGDAAWLAVPGEIFVENGFALRRRSPFRRTFPVGLANGYLGYMPTDVAFRKGGYEAMPARSSRLAPGTEAVLLREGARTLEALFKLNHHRTQS